MSKKTKENKMMKHFVILENMGKMSLLRIQPYPIMSKYEDDVSEEETLEPINQDNLSCLLLNSLDSSTPSQENGSKPF
ncbi:hypothetical protein V6N12_067128 [Hibiscus sabdariffa]|uniref:Uncharacterized protein n=1 Tax=Hibiscus sabdariffa TaxID=183260 RepID=A0ABR2AV65_9ROSI